MSVVTIIGKGNMGQAIAGLVTKGGHAVELLGSGDAGQPVTGELVVLAVPHTAVPDVLAQHGAKLAGKVVVDITNPIDFATFSTTAPAGGSAADAVAEALPDSRVLKAFNTTFAATLARGTVGELPTTVLIAGDDAAAKEQLAGIVESAGLKAIDAGPLRRARELEALALLQIALAAQGKIEWTKGFAVVH